MVRVLEQVHNPTAAVREHKREQAAVDREGVQHKHVGVLEAAADGDDDGGRGGGAAVPARRQGQQGGQGGQVRL